MFLKQKQQEVVAARKFSKKDPPAPAPASDEVLPPVKRCTPGSVADVQANGPVKKKQRSTAPPVRKYTDYYKHTPEIAWRLSGIPPPYLTPMQEDRVVALFPLVVESYKTSPRYLARKSNRTNRVKENPNLLNYLFVFYKLCQLLGYEEFLPFIPLPKSASNIEDCDANGWRHICKVNGWTFIPTC
jgi:hypothetical protein